VSVQLADAVGIGRVIEAAKRLGVHSDLPAVPSLALGSAEVNLLEMTRAFAAIAANVESVEAYSLRSIQRGYQTLHARAAAMLPSPRDPGAREAMRDLLVAVLREGTGKGARSLDRRPVKLEPRKITATHGSSDLRRNSSPAFG
jgi:penicillin-binding protein 1A